MPDLYDDGIRFLHLGATTSGVFVSRQGPSKLIGVTVNTTGTSSLRVYNHQNTTIAGNAVAIIDCTNAGTFSFDVPLPSGITVEKSLAAGDVTVIYR